MIGGIIGTDVVRYDIYGKDVLIANKMESNGVSSRIMVSESTKNLLESKYFNSYLFEYQTEIQIETLDMVIDGYLITQLEEIVE